MKGICEENIEKVVNNYFNLDYDYEKVKKKLSKIDKYMQDSVNYGSGIRILNQDLWETIISFIISANNNIPRIKGILERISRQYGKKMVWDNKEYYAFPTPKELGQASISDLRKLGLGFRDIRVYETTKMINNKEVNLEELNNETDVEIIRNKLLLLPGVGPKVADCIMLFGLNKKEVFPIDVWIERVMNELYCTKNVNTSKMNKIQIQNLAKEKYGNLAGIAQQYLFYWKRETG